MFNNEWTKEIDRLKKENKILNLKLLSSLANNLCPDHRDKQAGKSCLACEIERLTAATRNRRQTEEDLTQAINKIGGE